MSKVKICGLSRAEDIAAVNRVMPDFIGFVFAPSRRRIDLKTAARFKEKLHPQIEVVGVFVNENIETVAQIYQKRIIDVVQLHGDETDEYIRRLKASCSCRVIKAIGVGSRLPLLSVEPDYLLFDTLSKERGGTGKAFDWNILQEYCGLPFFLAGGLTSDTVSNAISLLAPFGVDISSGVETDGIKDEKKIEEFVRLVRGLNK